MSEIQKDLQYLRSMIEIREKDERKFNSLIIAAYMFLGFLGTLIIVLHVSPGEDEVEMFARISGAVMMISSIVGFVSMMTRFKRTEQSSIICAVCSLLIYGFAIFSVSLSMIPPIMITIATLGLGIIPFLMRSVRLTQEINADKAVARAMRG